MRRKTVSIPDDIRSAIAIHARNVMAIHRMNGAKHISISHAQEMLLQQGELVAQEIFQQAMAGIEKQELLK